ncbi:MAG: hypothetical protein AAFO02_11845, partial [Bacteroidota bacterium]
MKGKKIILLLEALDRQEMQSFGDFIRSPYFNKNPLQVTLVEHLTQQHPQLPANVFEVENLPSGLFPKGQANAKKLSYLLSDLQQLVEQFLVVNRLQKRPLSREYICLNALREHELYDLYLPRLKKLHDRLAEPEVYHREALTVRYFVSDMQAGVKNTKVAAQEDQLQTAINHLYELFLTNVLRYAYEGESRQSIQFIQATHIPLLEQLEPLFEEFGKRNPLIKLYNLLYACVRDPQQDESFDQLRELVSENQHLMARDQLRTIYLATINLSLRKMRSNPGKYTQSTLDLYTEGIENRALIEANNLSQWTFTNTIRLALRAKQDDWAENFIGNYQGLLLKEERPNALGLNKAELAFVRGDFNEVLAQLNDVSTVEVRYHILVNTLKIKALWELEEHKSATAALLAFKVYLSRTKRIAPPLKKGAQNFCQFLHRISVGGTERKRLETKEKILQSKLLIDKQWVLKTFQKANPTLV